MDKLTLFRHPVAMTTNAADCVLLSAMSKKKLTNQQSKFVEAMANPKTKNQTQAAIAAGCPPKSARVQASKWLTKANISEAIEYRRQRALAHYRITPEEVLGSAAFQMRSSMNDVLDDKGSFSLKKARATGAVDLIKKHKETKRTVYGKDGNPITTTKTIEVELLTNQDGRKEVANYIGVEKLPHQPKKLPPLEELRENMSDYRASVPNLSSEQLASGLVLLYAMLDPRVVYEEVLRFDTGQVGTI